MPDRASDLGTVPVGARAQVVDVGEALGRDLRLRLFELGLLPGTEVTVVRVAPLGDPIEIRLRGYALSLRRTEARAVRVRSLAAAAVGGVG